MKKITMVKFKENGWNSMPMAVTDVNKKILTFDGIVDKYEVEYLEEIGSTAYHDGIILENGWIIYDVDYLANGEDIYAYDPVGKETHEVLQICAPIIDDCNSLEDFYEKSGEFDVLGYYVD